MPYISGNARGINENVRVTCHKAVDRPAIPIGVKRVCFIKLAYDYAQGTNDVLWDRRSNNGAPDGAMQRIVNRNDQLNTQTQLSYINSFETRT
jgi:hypothetical protein